VADALHELLLNSCLRVVVRDPDQPDRAPVTLPPARGDAGRAEPEDAMLPYPRRVFAATRCSGAVRLPAEFLFVDVAGVAAALRQLEAGRARSCLRHRPFDRPERRQVLELGLSASALRLGCTPIVNLFPHVADPILLTERQTEYIVVPDVRRRLEIEPWSVDKSWASTRGVAASRPRSSRSTPSDTGARRRRAACSGTRCAARARGAPTAAPTCT
jgi:type VI secretion system protein ImpG